MTPLLRFVCGRVAQHLPLSVAVGFALVVGVGCQQHTPTPTAPASNEQQAATSALPSPPSSGRVTWRFPTTTTWTAIGDLHGDLAATQKLLRAIGVVDDAGHWAGGRRFVIQLGDQVDRGDDDRAVLAFTTALDVEAQQHGGRFLSLLGNHELLVAACDQRYVSPKALASFADGAGGTLQAPHVEHLAPGRRGHCAAFTPGAPWALQLATRPLFAVVGDALFVHGGLTVDHQAHADNMVQDTAAYLRGQAPAPAFMTRAPEDRPLWRRAYSLGTPDDDVCTALDATLRAFGVRRMVVAHTVQRQGITSACGDKVWRIDTGLSHAYGGLLQALEMTPAHTLQVHRTSRR